MTAETKSPPPAHAAVRWLAAAIAIVYGCAKLTGAQFTILDSELDKPLRDVNGFWLTWHYFSYSKVYGNLIALAQIAGGLLLTMRRWSLAGALLLLPVAANIVLVDVFYGVDLGGLLSAIVFLTLLVIIVAPHARRLIDAIVFPEASAGARAWIGRIALVALAAGGAWWVANVNNRFPTSVDGAWAVEPGSRSELDRVFFERNRAYMAVLKDTAGNYERRHFELSNGGAVTIWQEWMEKGDTLYEGRYDSASDAIELRSISEPADTISLRRMIE